MAICNFRAGDTQQFDITVMDDDGAIVDITHNTIITYLMKTSNIWPDSGSLPNVLRSANATIVDGEAGEAQIIIDAADTTQLEPVTYYYEFTLQDTSVVPNLFSTLDYGKVQVLTNLSS